MKRLKLSTMLVGLTLLGFSGCGSSDTTEGVPDTGAGASSFAISPGTYCYKITDVSAINDGCDVGAAGLKGTSVPGNYEGPATGIFTLGNQGKLGGGVISHDQGTLIRTKGVQTDSDLAGCSWNVETTTQVTMTAENKFTGYVTENQDSIAEACGVAMSSCQTTWTGTFAIDGSQSAAAGCK
jgi:hypothetical protein